MTKNAIAFGLFATHLAAGSTSCGTKGLDDRIVPVDTGEFQVTTSDTFERCRQTCSGQDDAA